MATASYENAKASFTPQEKDLMQNDGLVIVFTGDGKGKTSAALGVALRAVGHRMYVSVVQFLKSSMATGEARVANSSHPSWNSFRWEEDL
jgi:ATP:corrinoid adenosyltransferase